jgi:hypothetical protein
MRARKGADSTVPLAGASCTMMGMSRRVGQPRVELEDLRLGHAEGGAVVGRHHHHHGRALLLRAPAALGADLGAEVRGGHDHRHAAGHVFQDAGEHLALLVREQNCSEKFARMHRPLEPARS